jgi:hypothetical protein
MLKNLKALGLALVAVLALGAVAANAAQAAEAHFTAETGTAKLTGHSEENKFVTNQGTVNCTGAFEGPVTELTNTAQTVRATYSRCRALFGVEPTINMNGCDYVFHPGTYGAVGSGTSNGSVDIVCAVGREISITTPSCTITVPAQTGLRNVHYQNGTASSGKSDITMTAEVTAIRYKWSGPFCIGGTTGEAANGTYNTTVTVTGDTSKGAASGISITST